MPAKTYVHRCENKQHNIRWINPRQCQKEGKLEHDGKWFCKVHHPPTVAAKDKERSEGWQKKWDAEAAANKAKREAAAEQARKASAYNRLIFALDRWQRVDGKQHFHRSYGDPRDSG